MALPGLIIGLANFHSWKLFKEHERYLLIKYEDLINKPELTFLNILNFIHKNNKIKISFR